MSRSILCDDCGGKHAVGGCPKTWTRICEKCSRVTQAGPCVFCDPKTTVMSSQSNECEEKQRTAVARKVYRVAFHFYTDYRADWTGEAPSDLAALVLAMESLGKDGANWCATGRGFKIIIENAEE